jgi:aminomethyltransferase
MVEFGGWSMPVQYTGILEEHQAVRQKAGLFDISHMGEFVVSGPQAARWLNALLTNDIDKLAVGQGQYTLMLNVEGGVIDDLIVYRIETEKFFLVVNASMIEADATWMLAGLPDKGVVFENQSKAYGALALQGPQAVAIFRAFAGAEPPMRNRIQVYKVGTFPLKVARTGYTGEDGLELFFAADHSQYLWESLLLVGKDFGLKPVGLGARDTLRLEACLPLNGNDLSPYRTPLEAGLGKFVSLTKSANFPGKARLLEQSVSQLSSQLMALKMVGKGAPPRPHYKIFSGETCVGELSSGTLSPTLNMGIALAYLPPAVARIGNIVDLEVRGQRLPAEIVAKPFYKRT